MSKSGMKKSSVHPKSEHSLELSEEQQAELKRIDEEDAKRKAIRKKMTKDTGRVMLGLYSLMFAVLCWLIDWMGIIALIATVLGFYGVYKLKTKKDKYYLFCMIAGVAGGIRFVYELIKIIQYFMK